MAVAVTPRRGMASFGRVRVRGRDRGLFGVVTRFRRIGMAAAVGLTVAAARNSAEMMAMVMPAGVVGSERRMRRGHRFGRPLRRRRRNWTGSRFRSRHGGRWFRRRAGRRNGRTVVGRRGSWSRVGDDGCVGPGRLRAGRRGGVPGAVPRPVTGWVGSSSPGTALGGNAGMGMGAGHDGGLADRLFPVSKARERDTGDQRPALVERQGDHRQPDRRGEAEQDQRCAARADQEPVAEDFRLQRR
jgi:hypothetical protein